MRFQTLYQCLIPYVQKNPLFYSYAEDCNRKSISIKTLSNRFSLRVSVRLNNLACFYKDKGDVMIQ
jgi:hypothetical protein